MDYNINPSSRRSLFGSMIMIFLLLLPTALAQAATNTTNGTLAVDVSTHNTIVGPVKWASEPRGRGTLGVLLSCTLTFIFCIWTVVHPNIIPDSCQKFRTLYKAVLMVISILNPEGLVILAYGQWRDAVRLNREVEEYWRTQLQPKYPAIQTEKKSQVQLTKELTKKCRDWLGMNGAFFVVMGGFTIDVSTCESTKNVRSQSMQTLIKRKVVALEDRKSSKFTATLTPTGFVKYLHEGYFGDFEKPPFDIDDIADKGKASNIAKLLSGSQAAWLLIQSAGRWGTHLHLSLLEIHILIQVACTALIFFFWWHKPLDVNNPIRLHLSKKDEGLGI
ncbi:Similar to predicted protein [Aspergillus terreus NIH2624]; acc. no. XP_001210260 [Pyronema omphalodes CBS 100304]|uniref:Uncharacterized protein n=1 Tax=Pyronema omphalodes (strain CBS 100304) TaxID=1076935 RepID=U4LW53_PYROM|nr:Similar to predicted protein [Aspergillus terreus NIH2624]; acc. no. XP_001210260 [Pyronema omphalodes CBS 100304]